MAIRPKRIAEGFLKAATGQNTQVSDRRMEVCNTCPDKKGVACGICGCVLTAKTKVMQESCPVSKWEDIKIVPDRGVAIRLHEVDKAKIDIVDGFVTITHNNPYNQHEPVENTLITLDIINMRADEKSLKANEIPLTNIWIKHCGCYESNLDGKQLDSDKKTLAKLDDSQHSVLKLKFNTKLNPEHHPMSRNISIVSDQCTIVLKIKGEVLKTNDEQ